MIDAEPIETPGTEAVPEEAAAGNPSPKQGPSGAVRGRGRMPAEKAAAPRKPRATKARGKKKESTGGRQGVRDHGGHRRRPRVGGRPDGRVGALITLGRGIESCRAACQRPEYLIFGRPRCPRPVRVGAVNPRGVAGDTLPGGHRHRPRPGGATVGAALMAYCEGQAAVHLPPFLPLRFFVQHPGTVLLPAAGVSPRRRVRHRTTSSRGASGLPVACRRARS